MFADFVVLSADPTATPGASIKDIRVERTVMGGKTVYNRAADAAKIGAYRPVPITMLRRGRGGRGLRMARPVHGLSIIV